MENYLQDRSQYVEINGEQLQWQPVTSGIPQGSVLGPLLFLIYINDLPIHVNSTIYMYADDTKIYREIRDKHDQEILQKDLDSLRYPTKLNNCNRVSPHLRLFSLFNFYKNLYIFSK